MSTRRNKQLERFLWLDRTRDAVARLGYWPASWHLHLEFSDRVGAETWFRRRPKDRGLVHLNLRVRESWLDEVLAKGLAEVLGHFVLDATPCLAPEGIDALYCIDAAYWEGREPGHGQSFGECRLRHWWGYAASYG